jgi:hypothetical protein
MFAWHGMKAAVAEFVQQCDVCQHAKHSNQHPQGLLKPLPIPVGAWQDVTIDFIEGLLLSDGENTILVVVDSFTKYAHFLPLKHPFTSPKVAKVFIDSVFKLHGMPKSIVSDRDRIFRSHLWRMLFAKLGTQLKFTTTYHPQTDGRSERVNQGLEMYLRYNIQENPKERRQWLPMAEFWYNTSHHSAIDCSPFTALYGHDPNLGAMPITPGSIEALEPGMLANREAHQELLKKHLADKNRTEKEFHVGDKVLLKLQPYVQKSVVSRPFPKLLFKFFGPYEIEERVGKVAY